MRKYELILLFPKFRITEHLLILISYQCPFSLTLKILISKYISIVINNIIIEEFSFQLFLPLGIFPRDAQKNYRALKITETFLCI